MASLKVPHSYSTLSWNTIKISTTPPNAPGASKVMILTINRPQKMNAFNLEMGKEMAEAFNLFDIDDRVKCIVVTGEGKAFCAGADLDAGLGPEADNGSKGHRDSGGKLVLAIHRCRKPIIAAMQGSAVGVGVTMTLPMNIRVVSETAKLGFVFARRGIVMEAASSFYLPRLLGFSHAMYLITTGAVVKPSFHMIKNLFSDIVARPEEVLPRALEIANEVAENTSTISTYLMKEMMWRNPGSPEGAHLLDSQIIYQLPKAEREEGIKSFLEKRPVQFPGSVNQDLPDCVPWWNEINVENDTRKKSKL